MHKLNNIRRFLAILAVLASLLVIATIAFRMQREGAPKLGVRKLPVQVDVSLQGFHYTEVKQGVKRWDLSADRAEYNRQKDLTSLTGVRFVLMGDADTGELQVTADRAEYHNSSRDVMLAGKVHGQSSKGMKFSTSRVTYVASRSLLKTDERVEFSDAGMQLEGMGMEFHTQTRRFKLMKDVSAVYRPREAR